MKKILFYLIIILFTFSACKSKKIIIKEKTDSTAITRIDFEEIKSINKNILTVDSTNKTVKIIKTIVEIDTTKQKYFSLKDILNSNVSIPTTKITRIETTINKKGEKTTKTIINKNTETKNKEKNKITVEKDKKNKEIEYEKLIKYAIAFIIGCIVLILIYLAYIRLKKWVIFKIK